MAFIDYYKILEVDKNATEVDIKKAYRKMARKYHPDLNPNDKEAERKFKELNEANEVLSNVENRKKYDAHGENWQQAEHYEKAKQQQQSQGRRPQDFSGFEGNAGGDYSDLFVFLQSRSHQFCYSWGRGYLRHSAQRCPDSLLR